VIFQKAAALGKVVAVHAEDEAYLRRLEGNFACQTDPITHSRMRDRKAAMIAVERAINLSAKYGTKLYILHMTTKEEVELLRQAKASGVAVFGEVTPNHLFLDESDYAVHKTRVQVNPPLRTAEDRAALWEALVEGTIDTLGTDHAPHTLEEKDLPFGKAPSGIPGVETLLPLMLDSVNRGKLTLEHLVELTRTNIERLFDLPPNEDHLLIDMSLEKEVCAEDLLSKSGWTPYEGRVLKGWPVRVSQEDIQGRAAADFPQAAAPRKEAVVDE